jgi:hypothetical protein
MNPDSLNKWLTLTANVGVLIGIIVVVFELRQTQTSMLVESSMQRAQMSRENNAINARNNIQGITNKLVNGEQLTPQEIGNAYEWGDNLLRHFEVMHFQNELGALDEQIWDANIAGLSGFTNSPLFKYLYPEWPNTPIAYRLRKNFVDFTLNLN